MEHLINTTITWYTCPMQQLTRPGFEVFQLWYWKSDFVVLINFLYIQYVYIWWVSFHITTSSCQCIQVLFNHNYRYRCYCIAGKFGEEKVWWINGSANRLLIVSTKLDGFSLTNHGRFAKFAKFFPHQIFLLYIWYMLNNTYLYVYCPFYTYI